MDRNEITRSIQTSLSTILGCTGAANRPGDNDNRADQRSPNSAVCCHGHGRGEGDDG